MKRSTIQAGQGEVFASLHMTNMDASFRKPVDLVRAIQERRIGARAHLREVLGEPVERLMHELITKHGLKEDRKLVVDHALQLTETMLRFRPITSFETMSWPVFRAAVLMQLARLAMQPFGGSTGNGTGHPNGLPTTPDYDIEIFFRPSARLGQHFFGGDWYAGRQLADGSLWIFLADVTGHGYYAYLLATALPGIWQRCWAAHPDRSPEPAELLSVMHDLLADCLPEGIFLECTLVRIGTDGDTTVAPAGGTRLLLRNRRQRTDLLKLRGSWLGLRPPRSDEQYTLKLQQGDELILATDGLYDQLDEQGGVQSVTDRLGSDAELFKSIRESLERSLAETAQKDDITMVLLKRKEDEPEIVVIPFPTRSLDEEGDVSV